MSDGTAAEHEIREPYPGLRPFLDHEQALLKGRDDQIQQVVERLARGHFVAIIGGSGSGKSSLIRAGVVPALRARAIKDAGDYWAPVVFTPGTVRGDPNVRGLARQTQDETPVTRLAWKFAQVMCPPGQSQVDPALCAEVTAFLRQGAGFTRLVQAYHKLLPRPGPATERARFLFVIDQFEELFHPHNRDNPDARAIVDALVEHFLAPDPRCYVVMTMRSEHLSDCAAYLHLPEAINRSFYLVRRLNQTELREVITEPAQVMVRRLERAGLAGAQPVVFEREVVARLLADVRRIEDDPDHLPLLQHLLARTWSAALTREGLPPTGRVPTSVTLDDLQAAVDPAGLQADGWLRSSREANTLRNSLQNWAEHHYQQRDKAEQADLDVLLRHLAYKDPGNGLYFQQRVKVDDPHVLPGVAQPRERLQALLQLGFLDTVNYLYWDDDNKDHITLKVSHEAFIRGWQRFRDLVDREADRFDEFVSVMRKAAIWADAGRPGEQLMGETELGRLDAAQLWPVLDHPERLRAWLEKLRLYRRDKWLDSASAALRDYLHDSRAKLDRQQIEQEVAERATRDALEAKRLVEEQARVDAARFEADRQAALAREQEQAAKIAAQEAEFAQASAEAAKAKAERDLSEEKVAKLRAEQALSEEKEAKAKADRDLAIEKERASVAAALADRKRKNLLLAGALLVPAAFLPIVLHGELIRDPAMETAAQYSSARLVVSTRAKSNGSTSDEAAWEELKVLTEEAKRVISARQGVKVGFGPLSVGALEVRDAVRSWKWIGEPLTRSQLRLVEASSSESRVNEELRGLLAAAPWRTATAADSAQLPALMEQRSCTLQTTTQGSQTEAGRPSADGLKALEAKPMGTALFRRGERFGLFIPDELNPEALPTRDQPPPPRPPLEIYNAKLAEPRPAQATGSDAQPECTAYRVAFSTSRDLRPALVFDARGAVMGLVNRAAPAGTLSLQMFDVVWGADTRDLRSFAQLMPRRQINSPQAKALYDLVNESLDKELFELPTRLVLGGAVVETLAPNAKPQHWQLLSIDAQPLADVSRLRDAFDPLVNARPEPGVASTDAKAHLHCDHLRQQVETVASERYQRGAFRISAWRDAAATQCFIIQAFDPAVNADKDWRGATEEVTVSVYPEVALRAALGETLKKDAMPYFPLLPSASWRFTMQQAGTPRAWWIGKPGHADWEGWLVATPQVEKGQGARPPQVGDLASPYNSAALVRLAGSVERAKPPAVPASGAPSSSSSSPSRVRSPSENATAVKASVNLSRNP